MVTLARAVKCPKCGELQVTTALKAMTCKKCAKSTTLKLGKYGYRKVKILKSFNDTGKASKWLRLYKEANNKHETGFFNYV